MRNFENRYLELAEKVLEKGVLKQTRNAKTTSLFGEVLEIDCLEEGLFPLLTSRKIFYKGAIGEFAAFLRGPKSVEDFERFGCNYWKMWGKADGSLNVDYGNKWLDFNGVNQLKELVEKLKTNPNDRRLIISSWDPANLVNLDLPCCHYAYQFYVREGKLDMLWHQRSADLMIGIPSDIVLAAVMLITIAKETDLEVGTIKMVLGDVHIYESHVEKAKEQVRRVLHDLPKYNFNGRGVFDFLPEEIEIHDYVANEKISYDLIA